MDSTKTGYSVDGADNVSLFSLLRDERKEKLVALKAGGFYSLEASVYALTYFVKSN